MKAVLRGERMTQDDKSEQSDDRSDKEGKASEKWLQDPEEDLRRTILRRAWRRIVKEARVTGTSPKGKLRYQNSV